jgi:hypothetical protein
MVRITSDIDLSQGLGPLRTFLVFPAEQCKQVSHGSLTHSIHERHVRIYCILFTPTNPGFLYISYLVEIYNDSVCRSLYNTNIITYFSDGLL